MLLLKTKTHWIWDQSGIFDTGQKKKGKKEKYTEVNAPAQNVLIW